MPTSPLMYCTDEDIAIRAPGDFRILCPKDQLLAQGADGVFAPGARWVMSSASVDFGAQGVKRGHVAVLTKPTSSFPEPGSILAVESVAGQAVTLRRRGMNAGIGQPPAPAAGLSGVEFWFLTFAAQIGNASFELNQRYGVDDLVVGRRTSDLWDPQELVDVCVLKVLVDQYSAMARDAGNGSNDHLWTKYRATKDELDETLRRVEVTWKLQPPGADRTGLFRTRIQRG